MLECNVNICISAVNRGFNGGGRLFLLELSGCRNRRLAELMFCRVNGYILEGVKLIMGHKVGLVSVWIGGISLDSLCCQITQMITQIISNILDVSSSQALISLTTQYSSLTYWHLSPYFWQ